MSAENASLKTGEAAQDTAALLARCMAGDDVARAVFITEYNDLIRGAVLRKLSAVGGLPAVRAEVDDISNEILMRLLSKNFRLLGSLKNPRCIHAWLVSVSRNYVMDYLRKNASRARVQKDLAREEAGGYYPSPEDAAMAAESAREVRAMVGALPPAERLAIELFFVQGLKYSEIAEVTGKNINTVAARLRRAKAKLRKMLEEKGEERS